MPWGGRAPPQRCSLNWGGFFCVCIARPCRCWPFLPREKHTRSYPMILLVDDDPDFLLRAEQFLPPEHQVMFATDAKHAMGLLSLLGACEFSVAVIDLNLPGEN